MGRTILGLVSGLLLGLALAVDLQQFAVRPLDSLSIIGLPVLGLAVGVLVARTRPFRRRRSPS